MDYIYINVEELTIVRVGFLGHGSRGDHDGGDHAEVEKEERPAALCECLQCPVSVATDELVDVPDAPKCWR